MQVTALIAANADYLASAQTTAQKLTVRDNQLWSGLATLRNSALAFRDACHNFPIRFDIMPELSRFYGIIIRMFFEASEPHHTPHFHAYYQQHAAVFSISPVALVIGFLPQRQQRLVEAWAELHTTELLADWQLLEQGRKPAPISPLQ